MNIFGSTSILSLLGKKGARPPFEPVYIYLLTALIGYAAADLTILKFRPDMLPKQAPPVQSSKRKASPLLSKSAYNPITRRNIFNADGKIPPAKSASEDSEQQNQTDGPAVKSQLPLDLSGTIVHVNPKLSVASIVFKSRNETKAFRVNDDLEGLAVVTKIERKRVTFRNSNNSRLEYIEIPDDMKLNFGFKAPTKKDGPNPVEKRGEFDFSVKREDLNKYTNDLSSILSQARMVPNIVPGSGGRVEGFRFVTIQPGSIYEKLGFKPMDVIKKVNNDDVNSPTKAMELYNALKKDTRVNLRVERNGRDEEFNYTIQD